MKTIILIMLFPVIIKSQTTVTWSNLDNQKNKEIGYRDGSVYDFNYAKMQSADSVTWFGWDYSHLIINDYNIVGQDIKNGLIPYWNLKLEDAGFGSNKIKKEFKGKVFTNDPRTIQSLVMTVNDSKLIDIYRNPVNIDSIPAIVKNYNVKGGGIGVVSLVTEIRKLDITVMVFTVVFDIKTKEVLYVVQSRGKAGDKGGFGRFYAKGLILAMKAFSKKHS